MRLLLICLACICIGFASCFQSIYSTIVKAEISVTDSYEIQSMVDCCGCKALLVNFTHNKALVEQFVVETGCGLYAPTKHYFRTNSKGKIVESRSFVAVTDESFTIAANEVDKDVFRQLDSIYSGWQSGRKRKIVFAEIRGFKEGSNIHTPLGVKVNSLSK
jgi:hypothetical protein